MIETKKYFPGPAAFFPAGPDFYIAYNLFTQSSFIIDKEKAYKYSSIQGLKKTEHHIKNLIEENDPDWDMENLTHLIDMLKEKSILRTLPETDKKDNYKSSVAVITCNRSNLFKNTIISLAENSDIKDENIYLNIFDDSNTKESVLENKQVLKELSEKYEVDFQYNGQYEKDEYLGLLISQTDDPDVIRDILDFAFYGRPEMNKVKGGGGNRNAALLMLAGNKIISFDDDIKYRITERPDIKENIILISDDYSPAVDYFSSVNELSKHIKKSKSDIVKEVADMLGEKCTNLINNHEESENKSPMIWNKIEKKESTIKAIMGGIYGGRWFGSHYGIALNDGIVRNKTFRKKKDYLKIRENPTSLLLPEQTTITRSSFFVTTAAGFDATDILPPFPPYSKNDDGIWSKLMLLLNKNSFIAHIPYGVFHETENKSAFTDKDYNSNFTGLGIMTALIIDSICSKYQCRFSQLDYPVLSKKLSEFAELKDIDFISKCHNLRLELSGEIIQKLENQLIKYKRKPSFWAIDVDRSIEHLKKQSLEPSIALPHELIINFGEENTVKLFKQFLKDYSTLLYHWPQIWNTAVKINFKRTD